MQLFDLDADQNVPTWYSSSVLLICAILLAAIAFAARHSAQRFHWVGLSATFFYLSADESASIHEKIRPFLATRLQTDSFSDYIWVVVYAPLVLVFALVYLRFLRNLPAQTRWLISIAGFLYVGGALAMEATGGFYATLYGTSNLVYTMFVHIEELLEMLGVVAFLYALLLYMSSHLRKLRVGSGGKESFNAGAPR